MNFQENYSFYYNLFYRDKDYLGESNYIVSLLNKYNSNVKSILELGCGTGNHALILAKQGYDIDGVDLSKEMVKIANEKLQDLPQNISSKLKFIEGDIRTIQTHQRYDAVISLFHVMSYQTSNEDLSAAFKTAKQHLKPGGIFLFDCWYGPGVLSDRPTTRVKRIEDEHLSIIRIAEPVMYLNENLVDINYQILVSDKQNLTQNNFYETHRMRYLFQPEVKFLLEKHQLDFLECNELISSTVPSQNSWEVYFLSRN
jgi:SAM-dependent methyltransferase